MRHDEIAAAKLLVGLGVIGEVLGRSERPLSDVRGALERYGFSNNEISILFDTLRNERLRGLKVNVRTVGSTTYWSLPEVFKG